MRDFAISPMPVWLQRLWAESGLAVAIGALFAILGPFGTNQGELLSRIGYWIALSAAWFILAAAVEMLLDRTPASGRLSAAQRAMLKILLTGLPMLLLVGPATEALIGCSDMFCWLTTLYPKIVLIGAGLTLVSAALFRQPTIALAAPLSPSPHFSPPGAGNAAPAIDPAPRDTATDCPLQSRLTHALRGPILCLEMEDHYVRVHTDKGSTLVLMRMGDAVAAMGEAAGMRVHRSWWVARAAVRGARRNGRSLTLDLENGLTVPVSQPYVKAVRDSLLPS